MTGPCRLVQVKYVCGCVIYVTPDLVGSPPPHFAANCPKKHPTTKGDLT